MAKEELEKEAEIFVSEKADKGNFDVEKFGKAYFSESSMKQALVKFAEKRIAELEKENAELKEKLKLENCLKLLAKDGYIKFTSDNLTKAKELLKQWLQTSKASGCYNINIVTDTEQFLSEEEK